MNSGEQLYYIIQSLSKADRKYISTRLCQNTRGTKSSYIDLYSVLKKQTCYNEDKIIIQLKRTSFKGSYSQTVYLLEKTILKILRSLYDSRSIDTNISAYYNSACWLYNRGLHQQAYQTNEKATNYSKQAENWSFLIQCLQLKAKLSIYLQPGDIGVLADINEDKQFAVKRLNEEVQFEEYYCLIKTIEDQPSDDHKMWWDSLYVREKYMHRVTNSFQTRLLQLKILAVEHKILNHVEQYVDTHEAIIQHWLNHPVVLDDKPESFAIDFYDYAVSQLYIESSSPGFEKLTSVITSIKHLSEKQIQRFALLQDIIKIKHLIKQKDRPKIKPILARLSGQIDIVAQQWPNFLEDTYFDLTVASLVTNQQRNISDWLSKLQPIVQKSGDVDIKFHYRILKLLKYNQLQNYNAMENTLISTKRLIRRYNADSSTHRLFIKYFGNVISHYNQRKIQAATTMFLEQINDTVLTKNYREFLSMVAIEHSSLNAIQTPIKTSSSTSAIAI